MRFAITPDERVERIAANSRKALPTLEQHPARVGLLSVCGYGPSLADTFRDIRGDVMTCSGAHDFLLERGITPKWHVEFDPRSHKARMLTPRAGVTYCIASTCHPDTFEKLQGFDGRIWHPFTDEDTGREVETVEKARPGDRLLAGGTNVGMRAIIVGLELGYRRFHLHGFDCCYRNDRQWAGPHTGMRHYTSRVRADGREFVTSDVMMGSTDDFFAIVLWRVIAARNAGPIFFAGQRPVVVHGDGLLAARLRIFERDPELALSTQWWEPLDDTLRPAA